MILDKIGYSYKDLSIVPETCTSIQSRSEIDPFLNDGMLPLFAAPMSSVVCEDNIEIFIKNKIIPIVPRSISSEKRLLLSYSNEYWCAWSLSEFNEHFCNAYAIKKCHNKNAKALIDVANGHMQSIYESCKKAKEEFAKNGLQIEIMIGNIANPKTYEYICTNYANCIDYVRVGIGGGAGCITSTQTGVHYPQATLLDEINKVKKFFLKYYSKNAKIPKVIADGGIRNYSDIIKALGLGADYVMCGSLFAQFAESAADFLDGSMHASFTLHDNAIIKNVPIEERAKLAEYATSLGLIDLNKIKYNSDLMKICFKIIKNNSSYKFPKKEFYGMSTKKAQMLIDNTKKAKTSEGTFKTYEVKMTMPEWVENFEHYMKSAMSYSNSKKLDSFIGNAIFIANSFNEIESINK